MKILIAEDNPTNQTLIRKILEKLGYNAFIVENGIKVMEELEKNPYDVILMDLQMPDMDGIECTKKIREKYGNDKLKIIALTADAFKSTENECISSGMDSFLSKPFDVQKLASLLNSYKKS